MDQSPPSAQEVSSSALEQFRQEWRKEVDARSKQTPHHASASSTTDGHSQTQVKAQRRESASRLERLVNRPPEPQQWAGDKDDDSYDDDDEDSKEGRGERKAEDKVSRSALIEKIEGLRVREVDEDDFSPNEGGGGSVTEPRSALEHYERAVERESQGNLGDSLSHYRQAYRLDAKVDHSYRQKHFPGKWKATGAASTSGTAAATVTTAAPVSTPTHPPASTASGTNTANEKNSEVPLTFEGTIASYAGLPILNTQPIIEGDREPPCPIRRLPTEVLIELLTQVAICDPAVFARLALVCKRFAYHVFTDNSIWKRIALGPEFGLASQQYNFVTDVQGREAIFRTLGNAEGDEAQEEEQFAPVTASSFPRNTDFRDVFHTHPRIRFSGIYISTVNYTRAGGPSATLGNWSASVHIVTYYRYLRFFRDGTVISLLTTSEPLEVVPHLTKENLTLVRPLSKNLPPGTAAGPSKDGQTLPVAVQSFLKHALRGRWRLCHPSVIDPANGSEIAANKGISGDIHIETEGAAPRYIYTMHLALKNGSRSRHTIKNNKLVWKGFWKYNTLTDDWADFQRRNDKAYFFARVRSYGLGF